MKPLPRFRVKIFHGLKMESNDYAAPDSCSALIDAITEFSAKFGPDDQPESYKVVIEMLMRGGIDEEDRRERESTADQQLMEFDRTEARAINSTR
jgi:hypothetical protein